MKVQLVKCSNIGLWYYDRKFPIIVTDAEESSIDINSESYNTFFSKYEPKDFYYSNSLHGFIAKSDCINDEEYIKPSVNYEFKARPWDGRFKPLGCKTSLDPIFSFKGDEFDGNTIQIKPIIKTEETVKFDEGKTCISDIPQLTLMSVAKVMNYGAKKYSKFNYSAGTNWLRYYDAAQRHMHSWMIGENLDESTHHHIDHAIASLMMLKENILLNRGTDDRNKVYKREV